MPPPHNTPSAFSKANATARHEALGGGPSRCSFAEGSLTGPSPVPAILRGAGADARRSAESHRCKTAQRKLALVHSLQRRAPVSSLPEIERYPLVIVRPPRPLGDAPPERRAGGARAAVSADSEGSHSLQFPTSTHASPFGAQVPQMQLQARLGHGAASMQGTPVDRGSPPRLSRTPCTTPRTHERKSKPEASDEPERGLLSGELTLASGPRGRSAARRAKPRSRLELHTHFGSALHAAEVHAHMLPLRAAASASYEHDAPLWPMASPPHIQTFESEGPSAMDWERSADDRAAASALAMLFECASQVEERGGRSD